MDLDFLKNFYELVLAGGMRKFTEMTNIPTATISRQLSTLERDFGHVLLERKQGVMGHELTRQGKILFDVLPSVFGALDNARSMMSSDPDLNKGEVTIYTTTSLIEDWLVPMLPAFFEKYPSIHLNFISHETIMPDEMQSRIISISPKHEQNREDIVQTPLLDFHVKLWASEVYLERYGRPQNLTDLKRHRLLVFAKDFDKMFCPDMDWYLKNLDVKREDLFCIHTTRARIKAAYNGLGIMSLSEEAIQASGYSLERVLPDLEGPTITMCLTYPSYLKDNKLIKLVEIFLKDHFPAFLKVVRDNDQPNNKISASI